MPSIINHCNVQSRLIPFLLDSFTRTWWPQELLYMKPSWTISKKFLNHLSSNFNITWRKLLCDKYHAHVMRILRYLVQTHMSAMGNDIHPTPYQLGQLLIPVVTVTCSQYIRLNLPLLAS